MLIRRKWYSVLGLAPNRQGTEEFYINADYVDHLLESGQINKWRAAAVVADVLKAPASIFRGLKRPGDSPRFRNGLIYCGRVTECFGENGREDPPEGCLLAVYIIHNPDIDELHAFDWDWKEEDKRFPGRPRGWETDYGEPI